MKTTLILTATALMACAATAQDDLAPITLKAPDLNRQAASLMQTFSKRASCTNYSDRALAIQDLSDLLWTANGFNRPENKHRTAGSGMNAQDIDIYVFLPEGAYLYDAEGSVLKPVAKGDFRSQVVTQQPAQGVPQPPVMLILVSETARFTRIQDDAGKLKFAAFDAGLVSQNISIFCAGTGLQTRCRAAVNVPKLKEILKLTDTQVPLLDHPVGYAK
ncbi:MAG: SagB/ThcOx family dehydrogenase [Kiritimatiellaeota bacterium]|nr:SagB/ThcOx family dehydrogenase [Kiritimatiellota bacterium]